ncbi:MAG: M24 family metallopeptidase [Acidobacteriaceae bacterium]
MSTAVAQKWSAAKQELEIKQKRLVTLMEQHEAAAILIRQQSNISWATAGLADVRVLIPGSLGVASLLVLRDGRCFYLTSSNEAARLAEEEFDGSGWTPVLYPWQEDRLVAEVQALAGKGAVLTDWPAEDFKVVDLAAQRSPLTAAELERFRVLGRESAEAVSEVLLTLEPGLTEHEMDARMAAALRSRGLMPSVLLIGTDQRLRKFRHAVARDGVLKHFGMLNICARKGGLCVSITRYIHFGALPQELAYKFVAAAKVQAALYDASVPGATADEIYEKVKQAYIEVGFPGEEDCHHQGGTAGYNEREWLARPGGTDVLTNDVALAWNPSIQGAKAEDTVLLVDGEIELITATLHLPVVEAALDGKNYPSAGVLLR